METAQKTWTIPELFQLSGGYWAACTLHAGVCLDVFTPLAADARTAKELAAELGANARGLAMLLDALAAMGLLEKQGETYRATPFAAETLCRTSPSYMGHIIKHHHNLVAGWGRLHEAVASGLPARERPALEDGGAERENFIMGMFNIANQMAPKIAAVIDLSGRKRLLDLGGGPGTYAIYFCRRNPGLTAAVYDLSSTQPFALKTIERFEMSQRIQFAAGDYHANPIPGGYDVMWLSHILHSDGPQRCAALLKKAMAALEPGGVIMIQEFILNDAKNGPLHPALFSLNMLIATQDGQAYSQGELAAMLTAAGAINARRLPLELPNGAGVMAAEKPGR